MDISNQLKRSVWEKGQIVDGLNPDMYRKDPCGAWIAWDKYGMQDNMYGWEISSNKQLLQVGNRIVLLSSWSFL